VQELAGVEARLVACGVRPRALIAPPAPPAHFTGCGHPRRPVAQVRRVARGIAADSRPARAHLPRGRPVYRGDRLPPAI